MRVCILESSRCYDPFGKVVLGHVQSALTVLVHFDTKIEAELAFDFHFECVSLGMSGDFTYETVEGFLDLFVRFGEEDAVIAVDSEQHP